MRKAILIVLAAGLLGAQTGIDVEQLQARGEGQVLVKLGPGIFNVGVAVIPGATLNTAVNPPKLTMPSQKPSETLSAGQRQEVADMIAAATLSITPGSVTHYLIAPRSTFTVPEAFIPGSLQVFASGVFQPEGTEDSGAHYQLTGNTVHFWPATVPHAGWYVHISWISRP